MSTPRDNTMDPAPDMGTLESLLSDLEREHETLLSLAGEQRDAVRHADARALARIVRDTTDTLGRIAQTEQERRRLIARPDGTHPTLDEIASRVDPEHAESLRARSASLRELMGRVGAEQAAVRRASEALAAHMHGLIEQVSATLSHAGTYSSRGAVTPAREQVVSGLDMVR